MSDFSNDVLIVIGHGASDKPDSRDSAAVIADLLRNRALFKAVRAGFLKHEPFASDLLKETEAEDKTGRVFLVPHMAHAGYITRTVIPRDLGLDNGTRPVYLCDPVGTHPSIPGLIRRRLDAALNANGIAAADCTVLLVGHGSAKHDTSADHTRALAETVAGVGAPLAVRALFLEQEPYLRDWAFLAGHETVVVAPFLMSGGMHGAEDIPAAFGIAPAIVHFGSGGNAMAGPFKTGEHTVWLQPPLGGDPAIADIVLARVEAAFKEPKSY
ncbi:MAG: CbiX/SirB N-terminal domain-containing protein [Rhodospirillales bacterium]